MSRPKEIDKTGLSEYYIYTVEGTETIPHGWSKRLRSFAVAGVPMKTVYHFEPAKYGAGLMKVSSFKTTKNTSSAKSLCQTASFVSTS